MKIISIASARPNFVKLAAVHHALVDVAPHCTHVIIHTGQHYDPLFSDVFFEQLKLPVPKHNLGIHGGNRSDTIKQTGLALLPILEQESPNVVLVYGDVNGAVGGAQAASAIGLPLGHVEAGLRSFDIDMPEEHNRIAIDGLSNLLFCTEQSGLEHIAKEDLAGEAFLVGNTMIDTLLRMQPAIDDAELPPGLPECFALATLHRPSNVDTAEALRANMAFLAEVAACLPIVLPAHHRLRASMEKFGVPAPDNMLFCEPMGYLPFLRSARAAEFILTDSGGIQEETVLLRKRCFTLRKNTERPVTIACGSNVLIDIDKPADRERVLQEAQSPQQPVVTIPPLWDGCAGERIAHLLKERCI